MATPITMTATSAVITQKTPRQSATSRIRPPPSGASTGMMPPITIIRLMSCAVAGPRVVSVMMARESTTPAAPVKPWRNLAITRTVTVGASAQAMPASRQATVPISRGPRRPVESDRGPITSWPAASPSMKEVSVSCTPEAVVPRSPAMSGKAGRYMSVASGETAESSASRPISSTVGA